MSSGSKRPFDAHEAERLFKLCKFPPEENPTADAGLRAIFAVAQRREFKTDRECYEAYDCKSSTYYKWKKAMAPEEELAPTPADVYVNGDQHIMRDQYISGDLHVTGTIIAHGIELAVKQLSISPTTDTTFEPPATGSTALNPPATGGTTKRWYVVFKGREVGPMFKAWDGSDGVNALVYQFPGCLYKRCKSEQDAQERWAQRERPV